MRLEKRGQTALNRCKAPFTQIFTFKPATYFSEAHNALNRLAGTNGRYHHTIGGQQFKKLPWQSFKRGP